MCIRDSSMARRLPPVPTRVPQVGFTPSRIVRMNRLDHLLNRVISAAELHQVHLTLRNRTDAELHKLFLTLRACPSESRKDVLDDFLSALTSPPSNPLHQTDDK